MIIGSDSYIAIAMLMALLSLWKTYSGPALAGALSYSYPEMLLFNVIPALIAGFKGWYYGPLFFRILPQRSTPGFRPKLRRFLVIWKRYGQLAMAFLAPVLVGIPSYTLLSKRLNQSASKTFSLLLASILIWSSLSYFGFLYLDFEQYISIESLIPFYSEQTS